jgi:hypothetical protein
MIRMRIADFLKTLPATDQKIFNLTKPYYLLVAYGKTNSLSMKF